MTSPATPVASQALLSNPAGFDFIKMLLFGDSGVGKTFFLGGAFKVRQLGEIFWISADGSHKTFINSAYSSKRFMNYDPPLWDATRPNPPRLMTIGGKSVDVAVAPGNLNKQYGKLYVPEDLDDLTDQIAMLEANPERYPSIVVDGLSAQWFQKLVERLKTAKNGRPEATVPGKMDYQSVQYPILGIMARLYKMDRNVFVTAAAHNNMIEGSTQRVVDVGFNYAINQGAPHLFDVIAYLEAGLTGRRLHTTSDPFRLKCKDRTMMLPAVIEKPTMELLFDYFSGLKEVE